MEKTFVIKRLPNNRSGHHAARILRAKGECHHRKRGRGARGKLWHQDLPMERATHFSFYGYPIDNYSYGEHQYFEFRGWRGDKPVIRTLNDGGRANG